MPIREFDWELFVGKSSPSPAMRYHQEDAAVIVPIRFSLAVALGLSVGPPSILAAEPPAPLSAKPSTNQQTADAIGSKLRQSGLLHHYDVDVSFRDGVAELSGTVADAAQREQAIRLAQSVAGVQHVRDRLSVAGAILPVQAAVQPEVLPTVPPSSVAPPPVVSPPAFRNPQPNAPAEATPIFQAPAPAPYSLNPPRMPPYAWPTYAPYNNYSRVAYPEKYPYNSWPYIGPVYPFPKVPPGWRSVRLEWDDGYWWYSMTGNTYNWWKLRYW